MTTGAKTIIFPVRDLSAAKAVFGALLGVEPYVDEPYYVGYQAAGQEIGLDPNGHDKGLEGPIAYWHVPDIEAAVSALAVAGAAMRSPVQDVGGGKLIATADDADGNVIGLLQQPT